MPLSVYPNVYASGSVPKDWSPLRGRTLKYAVTNKRLLQYLRQLLKGQMEESHQGRRNGRSPFF